MQRIQNDWRKSVMNNLFKIFPFNSLIIVKKKSNNSKLKSEIVLFRTTRF